MAVAPQKPPTRPFRKAFSVEERTKTSTKIRSQYPDRIPVVVERANNSNIAQIEKNKFLVPGDITIGRFIFEIRQYVKLEKEQAIFLYVADIVIPPSQALVATLYDKYKEHDGFLYVQYAGENTFGGL